MKRILRIAGFILLGFLVISTFVFLWQKSRPKVVTYEIETTTTGTIEKRTVATGKVEPRNEILIKPQMSGIISEIYKEAGEAVQAGDLIAKIQVVPDMVNLSSAESRVQRAQLAASQSRSNYERDNKLYENDVISRGELEKGEWRNKNDKKELREANDTRSRVRTASTR